MVQGCDLRKGTIYINGATVPISLSGHPCSGVGVGVGFVVSPHAEGPAPPPRGESRQVGRSLGGEVGWWKGRGALGRTSTAAGQGHV